MSIPGLSKSHGVHRLVAMAFIGMPPDGMEINHKNGNKSDNRLDNLEYVTHSQNVVHAHRNGLINQARGERINTAILTADQVREIRLLAPVIGQTATAKQYGVTKHAIWRIVHRKCWLHVD